MRFAKRTWEGYRPSRAIVSLLARHWLPSDTITFYLKERRHGSLPQKVRELVLDAYAEGVKTASITRQLKVRRSWARRARQRWQERQIRNAIAQKHGPDPKLTQAHRLELAKLVQQTPDATLQQLHEQLNRPVSISTVVRALSDLKLTLKNISSRQRTESTGRETQAGGMGAVYAGPESHKLVFSDEIGVNTKLVGLYGRSPQGQRLIDFALAGRYSSSTLLAGMRLDGIVAPMLLDGPVNSQTFAGYVEQCLAPALEPGDILIIDNLPAHKSARVTAAVAAAGCMVVYLPPYSPDFNPIENMWSKVKASVRAAAARTLDAVVNAVGVALHSVTPADFEGYLSHCGHGDSPN